MIKNVDSTLFKAISIDLVLSINSEVKFQGMDSMRSDLHTNVIKSWWNPFPSLIFEQLSSDRIYRRASLRSAYIHSAVAKANRMFGLIKESFCTRQLVCQLIFIEPIFIPFRNLIVGLSFGPLALSTERKYSEDR